MDLAQETKKAFRAHKTVKAYQSGVLDFPGMMDTEQIVAVIDHFFGVKNYWVIDHGQEQASKQAQLEDRKKQLARHQARQTNQQSSLFSDL